MRPEFLNQATFSPSSIPIRVNLFSIITILPTVAATSLLLFSDLPSDLILNYQLNYSAIILAFQGAIHLGMAYGAYGDPIAAKLKNINIVKKDDTCPTMEQISATVNNKERTQLLDTRSPVSIETNVATSRMLWAFLPSTFAFSSLNLPPLPAIVVLAVGYAILCIYDVSTAYSKMAPYWFPAHRIPHSTIMVLFLVVSFFLYGLSNFQKNLKAKTELLRREVEDLSTTAEKSTAIDTTSRRKMLITPTKPHITERAPEPPAINFEEELKKG